ncbi:O-antigen ligase family protein [Pseudomonadota bacterium]
MGKKRKQQPVKKLSKHTRVNERGNASREKIKTSALVEPPTADWNLPVLFLMLVIIAIPVLGPTLQLRGPPGVIRLSFLLPAMPLLLLYVGYKKSAIRISLQPVMLALWGIVALGVISSLWAVNIHGAITGSVKWICVVLMSTIVYSLARDVNTQHKIFIACAIAGGYMAFIGVTQYLIGHHIYLTPPADKYPWPSATSGHKNMASQFVVMTLPFALYLSLNAKRALGYNLSNLLIALMLAYIVYGRARQAFVAVSIQFFILLVALCFRRSRSLLTPYSRTKDFYLSIITSLAVLVALVLAPPFDKPFSWDKTAVSEFASRGEVFQNKDATLQQMSSGRIATWAKTLSMIYDNPGGVGLNNFMVHYEKYNSESDDYYLPLRNDIWTNAHNDYLQLFAELGLPVLLIMGLMIIGLWKVFRLIWTKGDDSSQRYSLFIGLSLVGLFVVMLFSFPLTQTATPMLSGVCVGLLAAMAVIPLSPKPEKRWTPGPAVYAMLLLVSVSSVYISYREALGWHHGSIAKGLNYKVFQPEENNPWATKELRLLMAQHIDEALRLEPYAPIMMRANIMAYSKLAVNISDEQLADEYRTKALNTALRYLKMWPYDSRIHMVIATRLSVPNEMAMEHIGKAIALDPGNLQLYDHLNSIAAPSKQFDQALSPPTKTL